MGVFYFCMVTVYFMTIFDDFLDHLTKGHFMLCHHLTSIICLLSINYSHFNLVLRDPGGSMS